MINIDETLGKTYGYIRVSTRQQIENNSFEVQKQMILVKYPDAIIFEEQKSGGEVSEILIDIIEKMEKGDRLVVSKVDRFSRDVMYGLSYFNEIISKGCHFEAIDCGEFTSSAYSRLMLTNLLNMAEFERTILVEKMHDAKIIAKEKIGFKDGRPKLYTDEEIDKACDMLNTFSYKKVAYLTGISISTLIRARRKKRDQEAVDISNLLVDYNF